MKNFQLNDEELEELRAAHRSSRDKRSAYRLNAVILLGGGWTSKQVSDALLIDESTLRSYVKEIKTNSGRQRLNINGAINIETMSCATVMEDAVNADSTIE